MLQACLQVQVTNLLSIVLDKLTARLNLIAHQNGENAICFRSVFQMNLQNSTCSRIHSCFPQLAGVHLA